MMIEEDKKGEEDEEDEENEEHKEAEEDAEGDEEEYHHDLVTNKVFASLQTFFAIRAQLVSAAKLLPS